MTQIRRNQTRPPLRSVSGVVRTLSVVSCAVAMLGAAGCAEPPNYATPTKVCGTKVDPELISPLLPPGKEFEDQVAASDSRGESCKLMVTLNGDSGGTQVMHIRRDVVPGDVDPFEVNKNALLGYGNPRRVNVGDDARIADKGALATLACPGKGQGRKFVLEIHLSKETPKDVAERRAALERFVRSHLPDAQKAQGCGG
ncbi:hypothetical protein ACFQVC_03060 [Streptomyces monticola]|uniref:DUF3558 domain-containing protein n=1 Tax=Streptomyces monticola TaxID=2666263 RepID=A0ABW2JCU2_9ACTN